jgi:hypothetical protein
MNLIQLKDHRIDEQTEQKRQEQYSRDSGRLGLLE